MCISVKIYIMQFTYSSHFCYEYNVYIYVFFVFAVFSGKTKMVNNKNWENTYYILLGG